MLSLNIISDSKVLLWSGSFVKVYRSHLCILGGARSELEPRAVSGSGYESGRVSSASVLSACALCWRDNILSFFTPGFVHATTSFGTPLYPRSIFLKLSSKVFEGNSNKNTYVIKNNCLLSCQIVMHLSLLLQYWSFKGSRKFPIKNFDYAITVESVQTKEILCTPGEYAHWGECAKGICVQSENAGGETVCTVKMNYVDYVQCQSELCWTVCTRREFEMSLLLFRSFSESRATFANLYSRVRAVWSCSFGEAACTLWLRKLG